MMKCHELYWGIGDDSERWRRRVSSTDISQHINSQSRASFNTFCLTKATHSCSPLRTYSQFTSPPFFIPPAFYATQICPLSLAGRHNRRRLRVLDLATAAAGGFDSLDDLQRGVIGNFAKDDVLAVEPAGHDCSDEELGAIAVLLLVL